MLVSAGVDTALFAVLGLLFGSFLNVVIHRLPRMLEAEWAANCSDLAGQPPSEVKPLNLVTPRSRCPHCQHTIRWYENIPVASYLALRGKCAHCRGSIGMRYPLIELLVAGLFGAIASRYGLGWPAVAWAALACLLVAQFFIDFDTKYLPDDLNYLILWLGLAASALAWTTVPLRSAVWGAIFGYLCLWVVFHTYRLLTGKEGFGYGDFKLLAGLGAWYGHEYLVALVLLSSIVGAVLGVLLIGIGRIANRHVEIPFGPYLAGAGLLAMLVGPGRLERLVPIAFPCLNLSC